MKAQLISYAVAALAMTGLWFFLLIVPLNKKQTEITMRTQQARQQLDDFRTIMDNLPAFLEARKELQIERDVLSSRLYTKNDILKLFEVLRRQAKEQNVVITEISPPIEELLYLNNIVPDSNQAPLLSIELKLEGKYIDFGRFVAVVEQSDYFRGINSCTITGTETLDRPLRLELGFSALLGSFEEKV